MTTIDVLMNSEEYVLPEPQELEAKAEAMPPKIRLSLYFSAMASLRQKDYSYQDIADWLTEELGVPIKRGQVSYVLNTPAVIQEEEEREEDLADEAEERP
jgi:hypothetical protein